MISTRNYCFDVIKFVCVLIIAIYHLIGYDIAFGTVVIVDCLFALSGFFLISKFNATPENERNALKYTIGHAKKLLPHYLFTLILLFVYINWNLIIEVFVSSDKLQDLIDNLYKCIPELLFLQNIGIYGGGINYPLWQVSTLLFASHILYSLIKKDKEGTINIICPLMIVGIYTYMANVYGNGVDYWGVESGFIYIPLLRSFGALSIGMVIYEPIMKLKNSISNKSACFFDLLTVTCLILLNHYKSFAYIHLIMIPILIFTFASDKTLLNKLLNKKIFKICGELSFAIYVNQAIVVPIFREWYGHIAPPFAYNQIMIILFSIVIILFSYITTKLVKIIETKIIIHKNK